MRRADIDTFRNNLFAMLQQTITQNDPLCITTANGNAVVLSEADYSSLMATIELLSVPGMAEKLLRGKATPLTECIPASEIEF